MKAGKLDRKIILQRRADLFDCESNLDAYGAPLTDATAWVGDVMEVDPWRTYATLRAEIVERKAEEKIADYGASSEQWITFRTRYTAGVNLGDRILFEGRALQVKEVVEIGRRVGLEIKTLMRGPQ